jgi:hypothetical protein
LSRTIIPAISGSRCFEKSLIGVTDGDPSAVRAVPVYTREFHNAIKHCAYTTHSLGSTRGSTSKKMLERE